MCKPTSITDVDVDSDIGIREAKHMYLDNLRKKGLKVKKPIQSSDNKTQFWCITASDIEILYDVAAELNEQLPTYDDE